MKYIRYIFIFFFTVTVLSCANDKDERMAATLKAEQQNDSILKTISNNWNFDVAKPTPKVQQQLEGWSAWQQYSTELEQKPTGTLTAYRQKAENLINKIAQIKLTIPSDFNKPQVRSRIAVLDTKAKSLHTYIALEVVKCEKITKFITEMTQETNALQSQFDEIIRISEVPRERGEAEMLRARDTTRMANPDNIPMPSIAEPVNSATPPATDTPTRIRTPFKSTKPKTTN